jgi:hypothetical protein
MTYIFLGKFSEGEGTQERRFTTCACSQSFSLSNHVLNGQLRAVANDDQFSAYLEREIHIQWHSENEKRTVCVN